MTRKEAKKLLYKYTLLDETYPKDDIEAFEVAIKALEQEPCEDCISRQAVLDINESHHGQMPNHINHRIWQEVKDLPSVQPKAEQETKTDIIDKIYVDIQRLRGCSCTCSDGIIDDIEDILDKYIAESEEYDIEDILDK